MIEHSVIRDGKAYIVRPCRFCTGRKCDMCGQTGTEEPIPYGYEPLDPPIVQVPVTVSTPVDTDTKMDLVTMQFQKFDKGKNALDLIPPHANEVLGMAMTGGAAKYGRQNCIADGVTYSRYIAAAKRHISAFECRRDIDPDSGLHALGHAAASIMILLELCLLGRGTDDRWPEPEESQASINRRRGTEGGE